MLLIDYLEDTAHELEKKTMKMQRLNSEYRQTLDRDLKLDISDVRKKIRKKEYEVIETLYAHMEEFRSLNKYFPELLEVFFDDPFIGKSITRKKWLLKFKQLSREDAQKKFNEIKETRSNLRKAKKELIKKHMAKLSPEFLSSHPVLKKKVKKGMEKSDAIEIIEETDKKLKLDGWLILLTNSMIKTPLTKLFNKFKEAQIQEEKSYNMENQAKGRGTVAEANAKRRTISSRNRRRRIERKLKHVLLSNPDFLKQLKKGTGWRAKPSADSLEFFVREITVHYVRENPWLEEMRKKIG